MSFGELGTICWNRLTHGAAFSQLELSPDVCRHRAASSAGLPLLRVRRRQQRGRDHAENQRDRPENRRQQSRGVRMVIDPQYSSRRCRRIMQRPDDLQDDGDDDHLDAERIVDRDFRYVSRLDDREEEPPDDGGSADRIQPVMRPCAERPGPDASP